MYNYYLDHAPVDVTPEPVSETVVPTGRPPSSDSVFSLLSNALGHQNGLSALFSEENLLVLGALAFLTYSSDGFDTELLTLAVLFLLFGL